MRNVLRKVTPTAGSQATARLTTRQLSRRERERRLRRLLFGSLAIVLALVVIIPLYGYWRENYYRGTVPVAVVDGQPISTELYAKLLGFEQVNLDQQINQMTGLSSNMARQGTSGASNPFQQQVARLQQERAMLEATVVDRMVEDRLIAHELAQRGLDITSADVDAQIEQDFAPPATPTPAAGAEPTPIPLSDQPESASARLAQVLAQTKLLTEAEFRDHVIAPRLRRERLRDEVGKTVPTTGPQVHARHILVEDEATAASIVERLSQGESFEALAKELSTDKSNSEQGGDLGWFGRGAMVGEFENAAFELPVGGTSGPVNTSFGFHVIQVLEKDEARPLSEGEVRAAKDGALRDWLDAERERASTSGRLTTDLTADKMEWAQNYIARHFRRTFS